MPLAGVPSVSFKKSEYLSICSGRQLAASRCDFSKVTIESLPAERLGCRSLRGRPGSVRGRLRFFSSRRSLVPILPNVRALVVSKKRNQFVREGFRSRELPKLWL